MSSPLVVLVVEGWRAYAGAFFCRFPLNLAKIQI